MPEQDPLRADHKEVGKIRDQAFVALENGHQRQALARLDYFWARLAMHIRAEHLHLFPALLKTISTNSAYDTNQAANASSVESLIDQLREDHNFFMNELAEAIKAMRLIVGDDNDGSLVDLVNVKERIDNIGRRLITHNYTEESQVYPLVESLLSLDEATEIRRKMKSELDHLPPRFVVDAEFGR